MIQYGYALLGLTAGLLAGVPAERVLACLDALHAAGESRAAIVGTVEAAGAAVLRLA